MTGVVVRRSLRRLAFLVGSPRCFGGAVGSVAPDPKTESTAIPSSQGETLPEIADDYYGDPSRARSLKVLQRGLGRSACAGYGHPHPDERMEDVAHLRVREQCEGTL